MVAVYEVRLKGAIAKDADAESNASYPFDCSKLEAKGGNGG